MMTSTSEVMETMFYLPVEFQNEPAVLNGLDNFTPHTACELKFSGDVSGRVTLVIPKDLLSEMTENFMGESRDNLKEEHLFGTLTETLNMICGNALSRVDSKIPFELDIPDMIDALKLPGTRLFSLIKTTQSMMAMTISLD
jgi:CheY-specific phosphatase CheX